LPRSMELPIPTAAESESESGVQRKRIAILYVCRMNEERV
jgi:hypothetical protein